MHAQLTPRQLESIAAVFDTVSEAPDVVKERAMAALALDASDRALEVLRSIGRRISGELRLFWNAAMRECSSFNTATKLDAIVRQLGPLLHVPPCEGSEEELEELHETYSCAFLGRGIELQFADDEPVGRRVAVMRAVFECIGDLCCEPQGHCVIDYYDSPEDALVRGRWHPC